jgi:ATP-dependent DNA ligase
MAFDILHAHGRDLRAQPLSERRKRLERELNNADLLATANRTADNIAFCRARAPPRNRLARAAHGR